MNVFLKIPNLLKIFQIYYHIFTKTALCLLNTFLDKYHIQLKINVKRDCKTISFGIFGENYRRSIAEFRSG